MIKPETKRQKIIDAAIHLVANNGLYGTSMSALAKQAGVATGSLYTYFDSKESLIIETFYSIVEESTQAIIVGYNPELSVKERFYYLLEKKIRFEIDDPEKFRFLGLCVYEPIIMKIIQMDNCESSCFAEILEDGKKENLLKDLSVHDFFYHIFGGTSSLLGWRLFNQNTISDQDIINMIDMAWDACVR
ncbi:MAG: TetR/AcrR family transcriptional regulator [Gammaproteobacteria bacterium]|nr:TetR/AcrR family transcriptional regulator [Gammaproteobacteria bacterium]